MKNQKILKPVIDWSIPKDSLFEIKRYISETVDSELCWYSTARFRNGFFTRTLRFLALILLGAGLLLPLTGIESITICGYKILSVGYICLATGGLILLFDKYFGLSSGFVRFYIAELEIEREIREFELTWQIEMVKVQNSNYTAESIINILITKKIFIQNISKIIQIETSAWATEFQTQIGELQDLLKQRASEFKTQMGTISIRIENSILYSEIELVLDETIIKKMSGTTSAIFKEASFGIHIIQIRAKKNDKVESFSQNFEVNDDKTTEVILKLP